VVLWIVSAHHFQIFKFRNKITLAYSIFGLGWRKKTKTRHWRHGSCESWPDGEDWRIEFNKWNMQQSSESCCCKVSFKNNLRICARKRGDGGAAQQRWAESEKLHPKPAFRYRYSFICQGTSTRRQRMDLFDLRVKLPPVTTSLTTQR